VFAANVAKVQAHNAEYLAGRVGWTMAVNGFADMTASEFKERFTGGYRSKDKQSKNVNTSLLTTDVTALPASVGAYSSSHAS
jgi:cathepsin L